MFKFLKSKTFWAGIGTAIAHVVAAKNPLDPATLIQTASIVVGGAGISDKFDRIKEALTSK